MPRVPRAAELKEEIPQAEGTPQEETIPEEEIPPDDAPLDESNENFWRQVWPEGNEPQRDRWQHGRSYVGR